MVTYKDNQKTPEIVLSEWSAKVANKNDPPTIISSPETSVEEDKEYSYTVVAQDVDKDDEVTLTHTITTNDGDPAWLNIDKDDGSLTLSGTPHNDHIGTYQVEITAEDTSNATTIQSFIIRVKNVIKKVLLGSMESSIGVAIQGANDGDQSGLSFSGAEDFDGDGLADLVIGAPYAKDNVGETYLIYGEAGKERSEITLNSLGDDGFVILGVDDGDLSGLSVSGAGDINGDGLADLIVGGYSSIPVYVVYGKPKEDSSIIDLSNLNEDAGYVISKSGNYAYVFSDAGDVNGDGLADLILGSQHNNTSYVIYGQTGKDRSVIKPDDLGVNTTKESGFRINGFLTETSSLSVSSAGDIDGDGLDDLIVSEDNGTYVVYGQIGKDRGIIELSGLGVDSTRRIGFLIDGDSIGKPSSAGDVNGDGYDDVVVSWSEGVYLIYGQPDKDRSKIELKTPDNSTNGLGFNIMYDSGSVNCLSACYTAREATSAGDVNGDGYDDVIVLVRNNSGDKIFVLFGKAGKNTSPINLFGLVDSIDFFEIRPGFHNDNIPSDAGDVNNDGFDDLIAANRDAAGVSYIVYGGPSNYDFLSVNLDNLMGETDNVDPNVNGLVGGHENDILTWEGGGAVLIGGAGNDVLAISDTNFIRIDGGHGQDTLSLESEITLDFSSDQLKINAIKNIERIDINDTGSSLILRPRDVLNLSTTSNTLEVVGSNGLLTLYNDSSDSVVWEVEVTDSTSSTYIHGNAKVKVMDDVTVKIGPAITVAPGFFYQNELEDVVNQDTSEDKYVVAGYKVSNKKGYDIDVNVIDPQSYYNVDQSSQDETNVHYAWAGADGKKLNSDDFEFDGYIYLSKGVINDVNSKDEPSFEEITLTVDHPNGSSFDTGSAMPLIMKTASRIGSSIEVNPSEVIFGKTKKDDTYLSLDENVFHGLTEFTIQMEFELDFERENKNRQLAFLLSLAASDARDNMMSIFLKDRNDFYTHNDNSGDWDLSISFENSEKKDQKVFLYEKWIEQNKRGVLTVSVKLGDDGEIDVYWKPDDYTSHDRVDNVCDNSPDHKHCKGDISSVHSLELGKNGAVFGNDQDKLGSGFDKNQAFEGKFYGLTVYNKMLHPDELAENADSLIYVISPSSL